MNRYISKSYSASKNTVIDNKQSGGSCSVNYTLGTRGFSRVRREFSVLAEGRHVFGTLHIQLPSTETTDAVSNKLQTGPAETFQKTKISEIELISKG